MRSCVADAGCSEWRELLVVVDPVAHVWARERFHVDLGLDRLVIWHHHVRVEDWLLVVWLNWSTAVGRYHDWLLIGTNWD